MSALERVGIAPTQAEKLFRRHYSIKKGFVNMEQNYDKTAWAEKKKAQRQEVYDKMEQYLELLPMDEHKFRQYLTVESRFYQSSVGNVALIAGQKPEATRYQTYEDWNKQNISIRKGEQSFSILVPNGTYQRSDGKICTNFDVQKVFDISQTTAMIPAPVAQDMRLNLKALMLRPVCPIQVSDQQKSAVCVVDQNQVLVGRNQDMESTFRSLSMALAHAELAKTLEDYLPGKPVNAFYARCVSFVVCSRYGVDVREYNFMDMPMILGNCNTKELRQHLSIIRTTAITMIDRTEKARTDILSREKREQDRDAR